MATKVTKTTKPKSKPEPKPVPYPELTTTGYYVKRSGSGMLAESYELKIENGVVVDTTRVSRAADLPSIVMNEVMRKLWSFYRGGK